jgi:two-component system, OmpR family, phosphate regulon sensor histidine kinase PhoR
MTSPVIARIRWRRLRVRALLALMLRVAARRRSYLNLCYVFAALPLSICYFVLVPVGLAVGVGTALVGVGLLLLLLVLGMWWWLGGFERELAMWWLGIDIPPMSVSCVPGLSWRQRLAAHLRSRVTWTSLLYLVAKFPFSLPAFLIVGTLLALTAVYVTMPVTYLVRVWSGTPFELGALVVTGLQSLLGLVFGLLTLHVANGLTVVWGRFARVMLGVSDTETRLAEATAVAARERGKAEQAEQGRRELIVNVSHELRTPIASIRGHVESLLMTADVPDEPAPPPEELRRYLGIVHRETERLSALVDDLLALARADAGELHLDVTPVAAGEVVEDVFEALSPLARRERQITLVREAPPGLPPVLADRQRLEQVLLNLARNAITYTPAGGIVSLSLAPVGPAYVALTVADTGMGIAAEDLEHIFERFYRTDTSRARASGGFGLGLTIVRDLVAAMGGTITAESTPGEGSRFRVLLRVAGAPAAADHRVER